jgi:hypothetical protein
MGAKVPIVSSLMYPSHGTISTGVCLFLSPQEEDDGALKHGRQDWVLTPDSCAPPNQTANPFAGFGCLAASTQI